LEGLLLSLEEVESESLLLKRHGVSNLGVAVSSGKAFYSAMAMAPSREKGSRVGKPPTQPVRRLQLGHDGVESKILLLGCTDA